MKTHFHWLVLACLGCGTAGARQAQCPAIEMRSAVDSTPLITTSDITGARAARSGDQWGLELDVTDEASKRVQQFSKTHVGQTISMVVDGKVRGTPRIIGPLSGKGIKVDGFLDQRTADSLTAALRDGCRR